MKNGPFKLYLLRRSRFRRVELDKCFVVLDSTRVWSIILWGFRCVLRGDSETPIFFSLKFSFSSTGQVHDPFFDRFSGGMDHAFYRAEFKGCSSKMGPVQG